MKSYQPSEAPPKWASFIWDLFWRLLIVGFLTSIIYQLVGWSFDTSSLITLIAVCVVFSIHHTWGIRDKNEN